MPVASEAELCNRALRYIGEEPVVDLEDDSKRGSLLRLLYPAVRDRFLADFRWSFATERKKLTLVVVENYTPFTHSYAMPSSPPVLEPKGLSNVDGVEYKGYDFLIENGVFFCNIDDPVLIYVRQEDDVTTFPEHFINAIALQLAAEISYSIDGVARSDLMALATVELGTAKSRDAISSRKRSNRKRQWSDARFK